nr:reverse transcriptase domain-containing protein [Tanacetum cinerariifolium]
MDETKLGDHQKLQLNELSELHDQAYENSLIYKERTKKLHDDKIKNRIFNVGDQVLLFNSRLKIFSGKLKSRSSGPFTIYEIYPYGTAKLIYPDGCNFKVNCHRLKHYHGGDPSPIIPRRLKLSCVGYCPGFQDLHLAISTTETEYVSTEKSCQQALWMKQTLVDYGVRLDDIPIVCDNKGAIDLSKNPVQHLRTKHIEIHHHFIRDNVQKGNISIEKAAEVVTLGVVMMALAVGGDEVAAVEAAMDEMEVEM